MNSLSAIFLKLFSNYQWIMHSFWILLACAVLTWIEKTAYKRLLPRLLKTSQVWDDALLVALYRPIMVYIWMLGISFIIGAIGRTLQNIDMDLNNARALITLIILLWFAMRFITLVENNINLGISLGKRKADPTTVTALGQVIRITVIVIMMLVGLQTLGISISALLTFGGIGGLAIGFAAKDTLANFLGGLMIFFDRPFSVGDWVNSPDQDIEGNVEHIGWRLTKIITFDKRPIYVPNGMFSTIIVRNPSRMTHRKINTQIGLRYQDADKLAVILPEIEKMIREYPTIDAKQGVAAAFDAFAESSLNFILVAYSKATDYYEFLKVQQGVFLKIVEIVHKHGADFAFPTRTLDFPNNVPMMNRSLSNDKT